jgi:hypothetical protein
MVCAELAVKRGTATTSAAEVELGEVLEPDALLAH